MHYQLYQIHKNLNYKTKSKEITSFNFHSFIIIILFQISYFLKDILLPSLCFSLAIFIKYVIIIKVKILKKFVFGRDGKKNTTLRELMKSIPCPK